jgi:hypothetical protein
MSPAGGRLELRGRAAVTNPSDPGVMLLPPRAVIDADAIGTTPTDHLSRLLYELLDAHLDTIEMADAPTAKETWAAHLDYLRDLQRVGRETLARVAA